MSLSLLLTNSTFVASLWFDGRSRLIIDLFFISITAPLSSFFFKLIFDIFFVCGLICLCWVFYVEDCIIVHINACFHSFRLPFSKERCFSCPDSLLPLSDHRGQDKGCFLIAKYCTYFPYQYQQNRWHYPEGHDHLYHPCRPCRPCRLLGLGSLWPFITLVALIALCHLYHLYRPYRL